MASKDSTRAGNIREFELFQAKQEGGEGIDAAEGVVDIKYYEDVLSNSVSLTAIITESGESDKKSFGNKGILDGLPVSCLLYTSPSPRDVEESRMPSSA